MLGSPGRSGSPFSGVAASKARRSLTEVHKGQTVALGGAEAESIWSVAPPGLGECAHWAPTLRQPDTSRSAGQLSEQSCCPRHGCSLRGPACPSCPGPRLPLLPAWVVRGAHTRCSESGVSGVGRFFCHFCKKTGKRETVTLQTLNKCVHKKQNY